MVVTPSGEDTNQDIVAYDNQGYDAVGFLAEVIKGLNNSNLELSRENVLEQAKKTTYEGRTGCKRFLEERTNKIGQYEILKVGENGWEKVKINSNPSTSNNCE